MARIIRSIQQRKDDLAKTAKPKLPTNSFNIDAVKPASPVVFNVEKAPVVEVPKIGETEMISQDPTNPNKINTTQQVQQPQQPDFATNIQNANTPQDLASELTKKQAELEAEIKQKEELIANIPQATLDAKKKMGINTDEKQLQELRTTLSGVKNDLLTAQDRQVEIGELGRQQVSDFAGTSGDFAGVTNQDLRTNRLDQLALSRTFSRLGDTVGNLQASIDANVSAINEQANAEQAKLEFEINQKNQILDRVIATQSNILSNAQKAKLEEVKFQNQLTLADKNIQADQKKSLLTELAKKGSVSGADLASFANMSYSQISDELARKSPSSATAWLNYTEEDALTNLSEDQYKRWQTYNKLDEAGKKERVRQEALVDSTAKTFTLINDMLDNDGGLASSVGIFGVGRVNYNPFTNQANTNKFRTDLNSLASIISLDTLTNLKATGATLGAISEKELDILKSAHTRLGLLDDNGKFTGRSNLSEADFRARLREIQSSALKVNLLNDIGRDNFDRYDLKNADNQTLSDFYAANQAGQVNLGGSTKNRPERNNNPINVKAGGVSDAFAMKNADGSPTTDEQGHLIFASPEDGVRGAKEDLKAKVNGRSRYLANNPTIAELGSVFAEDPNWGRSVASILGVGVNSKTQDIDFEKLFRAVARQEGGQSLLV